MSVETGRGEACKFLIFNLNAMICTCPLAAAIPTITAAACPESFGQIQKVVFQRLKDQDGNANGFATETPITALASWTALLSAKDGTKAVVSTWLENPTNEAGEAITYGSGNEVLNGVPLNMGRNASTFTAVLNQLPQSIVKEYKQMQCEAWSGGLGVYLLNQNGSIGCLKGATDGEYHPIPIQQLFVGDKVFGGLEAPDSNAISWSFPANVLDDFVAVTPEDFNPLTDLANPVKA